MAIRVNALTCWCLLFTVPVCLMAADADPAMLSGSGVVKVNGTVVPRSSTVYSGDKVNTERNSTVSLTNKSMVVVLPSESAVVYGNRRIQFEYGSAVVNAQASVQAQFGNLTISPAVAKARFQMQQTGATLTLAALEGPLNVTDGVYRVVLPAGQMMTHAAAASAQSEPQAPPPPGPPEKLKKHGIPNWEIGMFVATGGAGLAGCAAAHCFGSSPASPSGP